MRFLKRRQTEAELATQTVLHRRLEIHMEREWVCAAQDASRGKDACPVCGDTSVVALGEAVEILGCGLDGLQAAIESGALHLRQTEPGEIAVCARSVGQKR
jgi:hypothetical protein